MTIIGDKCDPHDDANVLGSLLSPIVPLLTSPSEFHPSLTLLVSSSARPCLKQVSMPIIIRIWYDGDDFKTILILISAQETYPTPYQNRN